MLQVSPFILMREMDGRIVRGGEPDEEGGKKGGREGGSRPAAYYFSLSVLFQPTAT